MLLVHHSLPYRDLSFKTLSCTFIFQGANGKDGSAGSAGAEVYISSCYLL